MRLMNLFYVPGMTLAEIEKKVIEECIAHNNGNKSQTAKALGISVRGLRNKLHEYQLFHLMDRPPEKSFDGCR